MSRPRTRGRLRAGLTLALAGLATGALAPPASSAPALDLETLTGPEATAMMEAGELTSVELTQAYLDRINALNKRGPGLNAVTQLNKDALKDAAALDKMRADGEVLSPAHGLPVLLKDLIDVKGMYTSAGNWSLRNSFPSTDSGIARKLRESGTVILGKTGLSEYANSFGRQPSGFGNLTGQVLNGLDADQNPSGSSSGSGSAGAAALSSLMIGTETSGSILSPSRANGLVGLRPTVGLVPGYGVAPIRLTQDTAGPMDRTVSDAALTLTAISGTDDINDAYYAKFWAAAGVDPAEAVKPLPADLPDYTAALDLDYVDGKRIGWNGDTPQILEAKAALEAAGAILVERPVIEPSEELPALSGAGEQRLAIDSYYDRLGPGAPIKSLAEEVADNQANAQEALKFGNINHLNASLVDISAGSEWQQLFSTNLPIRKRLAWESIDRMMANDTPDDPSDDFIAILGAVSQGPLAGYPAIQVPMGYDETSRRATSVAVNAAAYDELDLLGVAYVIEQATKKRLPASDVNPSMYRCAKTVPAPAESERGDCNPDYDTLMKLVGEVPELPFSLETETAQSLQARMTAGTLSAETLTKAYLARIALANAEGPAIQAVRAVNTGALETAKALDAERGSSGPRGPLHGIPVMLDDLFDVEGMDTTGGSIALQGSKPAADATLVAALEEAGAIILGKTNVSELGGAVDEDMPNGYSALGGQVLLPSDTDKTTAGSAAGSAAATASGMAAMTVGLETSPETAQLIAPASVAGVVGLKPTVGLVSRTGVLGTAKSQDSPGPIAKSVYDAATQLQVIAGEDASDPATGDAPPVPDYAAGLSPTALDGKRVGVVTDTLPNGTPLDAYPGAVATLGELGATTVLTTVAAPDPALPGVGLTEFKRDLNSYLGGVSGGNAGSLEGIIEYNGANAALGLKYQQEELVAAQAVDLTDPATEATYEADKAAGLAGSKGVIDGLLDGGTPGDPSDDLDAVVVPPGSPLIGLAAQAGYPLLTVPAGYGTEQAGRNPVGITFVGKAFSEDKLLAMGYAFEQKTKVRLAPSFTNPSMWRCVEGSTFFDPYNCNPGDLKSTSVVDPVPAPEPVVPAPVVRSVIGGTAFTQFGGFALVTGSNLGRVSSVKVGARTARFTQLGTVAVLVYLPPLPRGTYDLIVTTPGGSSAPSTRARITYRSLF